MTWNYIGLSFNTATNDKVINLIIDKYLCFNLNTYNSNKVFKNNYFICLCSCVMNVTSQYSWSSDYLLVLIC